MAMDMDMDDQLFRQQHGWSLQLKSGQEITLTPGANEASEPLCITDVFLVEPESAAGQSVVAAFVEIGTRNIMLGALSSERPRVALQTPVVLDEQFCFYLMRPEGDAEADAVVVQFQGYALPSADTKGEMEEGDGEDVIIDDVNDEEEEEEGDGHDTDDEEAEGDGQDTEEEEEGDGQDTEDDEDATGSDYEDYGRRADGEVCGLPLGVEIEDGPRLDDYEEDRDHEVGGRPARARRASSGKAQRHRRSFVTEAEGRSLVGHRRRFSPEAVVLGIFVFLYLIAMVVFICG